MKLKTIKLKAGVKYGVCSCGMSRSLPLCDNAHRQFNKKNNTNYKSVKISSEIDSNIFVTSSTWEIDE